MRPLPLVVVVQSIVLVPLALTWLLSTPAGSVDPGVVRVAPAGADPAALDASAQKATGAADAPAPQRTLAEGANPEAAGATVVVHGRILAADGGEAPTEVNVGFRQAGRWRSGSTAGAHYAVPGLTPGSWRVRVQADGFAVHHGEHVLGTEPVQSIDLTLARAQRVKVFLRTPDGGPLHAAFAKVFALRGLHVVATAQPLERDLPPSENVSVGDLEAGRYRSARELPGPSPGPTEPDGELQLDQPAPVHATLLLRHLVLARQVVVPAQEVLTFTLDPKEVFDRLATVRLRVVDGASGNPLAEVSVSLNSAQGGGAGAKSGADGVAVATDVPPGLSALLMSAKGTERYWTLVRVPAGGTLDLGEVTLHAAVTLRGRLLDASGKPIAGSVRSTPLDTMTFPRTLIERHTTGTDGDGEFSLSVGRRRYVLVASSEDGCIGVATAEGGASELCEIRLAPAVTINVLARGNALAGYVATVRDRGGVPIAACRIEPRWREQTMRVPPGDYTLEVHDDGDRPVLTRKVEARAGSIDVEVQR